MKLDWESSMVWFPCPEGCGSLIRLKVRGLVGVYCGEVITTTAEVDRSDWESHMVKSHGKVNA